MNETQLPYKSELGGTGDSDTSVAEVNTMLRDADIADGEVFGSADSQMKNGLSELIHDSGLCLVDTADRIDPPLENRPSISDVKRILALLVTQNLQLRTGGDPTGEATLSAGVQNRIQDFLTDETCNTFAEHIHTFERQKESLSSNGINRSPTMNNQERIPTAPRAMLNSERVRLLENLVRLRERGQALSTPESQNLTPVVPHNPVIQIPIPLPATIPSTPTNISSHPTNTPVPGPTLPIPANASTGGIAIPMDPKFFSPVTLREREEGEVSSSSITPKRLSTDCTRGKQTIYTPDERDYKRRSSSPEPVRHRLPSSRTYCNPRSPEGTRRPRSPLRNSSKSSRLSQSPRRIKRPYSPDRRRSRPSPSPEAAHGCSRRASSPNIWPPRPFESKSPHPSPHRRRASEYDVRASKSRNNETFRANTFPDFCNKHGNNHIPLKVNQQGLNPQDNAREVSEEAPSQDHRRSNHERLQAIAQGQESITESPLVPTGSMSPATTTDSARGIGEPAQRELLRPTPIKTPPPPKLPLTTKRTPSPFHPQAKSTGGPPGRSPSPSLFKWRTPSPVLRVKESPEDIPIQGPAPSIQSPEYVPMQEPAPSIQSPEDVPMQDLAPSIQEVKFCHNVPGLWMMKTGQATVEILTCEFEIDRIAADRWGIRDSSRHGKAKLNDMLSLKLVCVPLSEVEAVNAKWDLSTATPQQVTDAIAQIETTWPPAGHLIIEINPGHDWGRSWLPRHLGEDQASIDIVDHVHEGINIIRFIQLAGLNDHMFLVIASPKSSDFYCLEPGSLSDVGDDIKMDEHRAVDQLLNDFVTSLEITYS